MSDILGDLGYDNDPDPQNEISIIVGNSKIVGWETVPITRSLELFLNNFTLTAADQFPHDTTRATVFPSGPGEKCQIFIGSDLVITGYVDRYAITVAAGRHEVTISGAAAIISMQVKRPYR